MLSGACELLPIHGVPERTRAKAFGEPPIPLGSQVGSPLPWNVITLVLHSHHYYGMVGLCISVAIFTFVYESIKTIRQKLVSSSTRSIKQDTRHTFQIDTHSERSVLVETESYWKWKRLRMHSIQALLYMVQVTMGYLLMLIIMSYNAWLAITVFAAAGFSYYFFSTFVLYRPSVVPIEILSPEASD